MGRIDVLIANAQRLACLAWDADVDPADRVRRHFLLEHTPSGSHVRFDAANLIGAIVTGISFLGAGMIIFRKDSRDVSGLTTSAGILTTAVIGMLVGLERYFLAVGSTAIVFFVLR